MIINEQILDELSEQAKKSPRLRVAMDLRNTAEDHSQRVLNAVEPGTFIPVHRHQNTSEIVICVRGHFIEYFYDDNGQIIDTIDMVPGGLVINVPKGCWHTIKVLESGTVLFEAKDGKYEPMAKEDIMEL